MSAGPQFHQPAPDHGNGWRDDDVFERPGRWARLTGRLRRGGRGASDVEAEDEGPGGVVVPLAKPVPALPPATSGNVPAVVEPPAPKTPGKVGAALEVAGRPFPSKAELAHSARVVARWHAPKVARAVARSPWYLLLEFGPVFRGLGHVLGLWAEWRSDVAYQVDGVGAAEGNAKAKAAEAHKKTKAARTYLSLVLFVLLVAGMVALYLLLPWWFWGAVILLLAALDLVGRSIRRKEQPTQEVLPALPAVLGSDVPLSQITASILATFTREGFEEGSVRVARPLAWDPHRQEYRVALATADAIKPEHLRAVERAVGARDNAVRALATETAQVRELVIRVGNPLAGARECEWIPNGALSLRDPLPLGRSAGELVNAVRFVGANVGIVGRTRSGKTEGLLWTLIDRLAACRDVVIYGCDLQMGPAFTLWRDVIQKVAYTPDDALALMADIKVEMDRRKKILNALAASDLPEHDNAGTVWTPDLGPYLVFIIDEFHLFAIQDGKDNKVDLMTPFDEYIRTGLKFGMNAVLASQKTGNSDFGRTSISRNLSIRFLLACEEDDVTRMLSTGHRDRGYHPHLLKPAQPPAPNDAGTYYIDGPDHTTPDLYRSDYWPDGSIKARARRRIAEGLPRLDGGTVLPGVIDEEPAVEVPPVLAAVEAAFVREGWPQRIPTRELVGLLRAGGLSIPGDGSNPTADAQWLADQLRPAKGEEPLLQPRRERWSPTPGANAVRGYYADDVRDAIRGLG